MRSLFLNLRQTRCRSTRTQIKNSFCRFCFRCRGGKNLFTKQELFPLFHDAVREGKTKLRGVDCQPLSNKTERKEIFSSRLVDGFKAIKILQIKSVSGAAVFIWRLLCGFNVSLSHRELYYKRMYRDDATRQVGTLLS